MPQCSNHKLKKVLRPPAGVRLVPYWPCQNKHQLVGLLNPVPLLESGKNDILSVSEAEACGENVFHKHDHSNNVQVPHPAVGKTHQLKGNTFNLWSVGFLPKRGDKSFILRALRGFKASTDVPDSNQPPIHEGWSVCRRTPRLAEAEGRVDEHAEPLPTTQPEEMLGWERLDRRYHTQGLPDWHFPRGWIRDSVLRPGSLKVQLIRAGLVGTVENAKINVKGKKAARCGCWFKEQKATQSFFYIINVSITRGSHKKKKEKNCAAQQKIISTSESKAQDQLLIQNEQTRFVGFLNSDMTTHGTARRLIP